MPQPASLRLAVDIGGTFTDTVLVGADGAIAASTKTLTTHDDPATGAMDGVRRALAEAGRPLAEVTGFIHGTTLVTNALIERRGATVATVATEGFRDILEIAYERRYAQYDINLEKPDLLVPRERSFTIPERMNAGGEVLIPLDEGAVPPLLEQIDASGAEAVAVCLLHSYANPAHERRLRELIAKARPALAVSISSEVSPEAREFDRLSTTVANAYIQPLMARYLAAFEARFADEGLTCPILMMTAGGGMTTLATAARLPIRLVESGPAGGAILAARIAAECGLDEVLSFDMGGTTAKLCLIDGTRPQTSRSFEIARAARFIKGSGMPVRIPVIEMIEIGAGGGSIAAVDRLGRLTVGPESAGSEPGPVAFRRGGARPTVTDADIVLGYIRPETFAEGQFRIEPEGAAGALGEVGEPLGLDATGAADGVSRIVDENMASAARMHAVESGKDLTARTMIAFGGNGPLHACRVGRAAGVSRILIPANPGVGSAVGFLFAPVSFEIVRSRYSLLQELDLGAVNALFAGMCAEALVVVRQGAPDAAVTTARSAFMRYSGQGHEIEIALPDRELMAGDIGPLTGEFEAAYSRQFSRPVPGMEIEILNWAVRIATDAAEIPARIEAPPPRRRELAETRPIVCDLTGQPRDAGFVLREALRPGDVIAGPALVAEPQTTTFVGADFSASVDPRGNLILTRDRDGGPR
ncbi:Acetophenone carboxylase gamma subunit [Defluviimonas aquaemixtae]|uniref:Acetophenone carboxylase gamma subunit n=1 Tax=Albidovulum aquaemixtae TaxID=1542388 RepID=A0A2R8BJ85_9RHOB|nr:hydantoinase/oxoprolinase family protein [Defluviimonas aquaemixtae]SPH23338.1 Acetophenone carboxylase gamma subunit [Defluviimonas aquaemixtae]